MTASVQVPTEMSPAPVLIVKSVHLGGVLISKESKSFETNSNLIRLKRYNLFSLQYFYTF